MIGGLIVAGAIFLSASVFMRYETDSWALAVFERHGADLERLKLP